MNATVGSCRAFLAAVFRRLHTSLGSADIRSRTSPCSGLAGGGQGLLRSQCQPREGSSRNPARDSPDAPAVPVRALLASTSHVKEPPPPPAEARQGPQAEERFQSTKAGGHTSRPGRTPRPPVRSPASRSHLEPLWFSIQSFSVLTRLHQLSEPLSTQKLPSFTFNHSSRWSQPARVFPTSSSSSVPAEQLVLRTKARAQQGLGGVGWGGLRQWAGVSIRPVLSACLPDDATHSRDEPGALCLPRHSCRGARSRA